jgi:hypothetical protein
MNARSLVSLMVSALVAAAAGAAQSESDRYVSPLPTDGVSGQVLNNALYRGNEAVGAVQVTVAEDGLPADGQASTKVSVRVLDRRGNLLRAETLLTVETSAGRVLMDGASTDELGARPMDADRATRGTQLKVQNGEATFELLAPTDPQDVTLRVSAGDVWAEGIVSFEPELREMVAAGLVEGVVRLARRDPNLLSQVRTDDGFEQQLERWSRSFGDGKGSAAGRGAVFLKGKISGQTLLTLAADSEKETRSRLLRDIRPEEFYPVYGDASIKGFDARSADRLYVRVDRNKNYVLYGDYATGDGFIGATAGGAEADTQLRRLGAYSRTLTGLRGHVEKPRGFLNVFGAYDSLKQVVEEYRANGTSGPYAVRNTSALENSEKVELVVRDRNSLGSILHITPLQRYADYSFEPFSGRLLFKGPVPSLDENGNPLSIRVTYEVDQGGDDFWLGGVDGQLNLGARATVGGSFTRDDNPVSPYQLASVNFGTRLGDHASFAAEFARSENRSFQLGGNTFTNPTGQLGELAFDEKGDAWRLGYNYLNGDSTAQAWYVTSDAGFENPNSGLIGDRREAGLRGARSFSPRWKMELEALRIEDLATDANRDGAALAARYKATERVAVLGGLRYAREDGDVGGQSFITQNPAPGSLFNPTGGFLGGVDANQLNPLTGQAITANTGPVNAGEVPAGLERDDLSAYVGLEWQATKRLRAAAQAEFSLNDTGSERYELGGSYQVAERARIYARAENNRGLASLYSLDPNQDSRAFVLGVDTSYLQTEDRTGQLFSEYRLRDAINAYESQAASGLRNTFVLRKGLALSAGAEYLRVLDGTGISAAALTFGLDHTASEVWKGSTRLELRRAFDNDATLGNDQQDSWLWTANFARKLDRNWTMLARNYYLRQANNEFASGAVRNDAWQDRFQWGFAYRPVDSNRFDALLKYEWRAEDDILGDGSAARVHIGSALVNWHPNRRWWVNGRVAAKSRDDKFSLAEGGGDDSYSAVLLGSRITYDISQRFDLGAIGSVLTSNTGHAKQYAYGLEAGVATARNLWLSLGYNWSGFSDDDLTGSDYTNGGVYLRLRFKFDENLFRGDHREINRALDR